MPTSGSGSVKYVGNKVSVHGKPRVPVLFVAEAPGPQASKNSTPLFGPMGGALFRGLYRAKISWVRIWNGSGKRFRYPKYSKEDYAKASGDLERRLTRRAEFLEVRSNYIACTNGYDQLPLRQGRVGDPGEELFGPENKARLKAEFELIKPRVVIIAGEYAYQALTGKILTAPESHEGEDMTAEIVPILKKRFGHKVEKVWYVGHPRKWTFRNKSGGRAQKALTAVRDYLGWVTPAQVRS